MEHLLLLLDQDQDWVDEVNEIVCAVETKQLDELPVTVKKATAQDPVCLRLLTIHYMVGLSVLVL